LDETSAQLIKRYFKEYYFRHGAKIHSPSEIESREFGYLPFGGMMVRHLSFKDIGALRALLVKEVPAGVYCSNSTYEDPTAEMHLKGWKKAQLIFDIDADTLKQPCKKVHDIWQCKECERKEFGMRPQSCPNCKSNRLLEFSWACRLCLEETKRETFRLLDFLQADFGIASSEIKVFFSGNAGYHVSVEKSLYDILDSQGRAEIADYVAARGLSSKILSSQKLLPTDPGWRGRIARFIQSLPQDDPTFKPGARYEDRLFELANHFSKKKLETFMIKVVGDTSARIDAMVTTDVHRIFRMPETLNNKTGLIKRECESELSEFDPLEEAIALKEDSLVEQVFVDMCPKIELGGKSFGPYKSEVRNLPLYLGVYIVSKGAGKFLQPQTAHALTGNEISNES
jgi:DNA primase small subunit